MEEIAELVDRHSARPAPPGLVLRRADTPTEPMPSLYEPFFALVVRGAKRTVLGDRVFEYGTGEYLVASLELPVIAHVVRAPYLVLGLTLRPALIAELLLEAPPGPRAEAAPGMAVSRAGDDLLDPVLRLLRLLDHPDDLRVLRDGVEREIVWRLLTGEQAPTVRQIGRGDTTLAQVSRAIRWIREHHADLFRVEDVARVAGMSVTSLHRHFRAITTMTPLQYQKQIRLQAARARLLAATGDVAEVGFAVGYESPSQFSREYRRLFGMPPGQDAARLRELSPAARVEV